VSVGFFDLLGNRALGGGGGEKGNRKKKKNSKFLTSTSNLKKKGSATEKVARAFTADEGVIGREFTERGAVGSAVHEAVGGPFRADASVGKQFREDGAVREIFFSRFEKRSRGKERKTTHALFNRIQPSLIRSEAPSRPLPRPERSRAHR
jgi:hypothetical protein